MSKLLYVISSPRGEQSESTRLGDEFLATYLRARPDVEAEPEDRIVGSRHVAPDERRIAPPVGDRGGARDVEERQERARQDEEPLSVQA